MKNKLRNILIFLILLVAVIIIIGTIFYKKNFAEQDFETLLYNVRYGGENANVEVVGIGFRQNICKIIIFLTILSLPILIEKNHNYIIDLKFKDKKKNIKVFPFNKIIYSIIIFLISILFCFNKIGMFEYIKKQQENSNLFEQEYVASESVKILFPDEKRNLIYIFLESMETSLMAEADGGGWEYNVIPELTTIAKDNINFSNTERLGGGREVVGASWTIAGMVGQTASIPLKVTIDANGYSGYSSFLPGVYALGDILRKEGYNLEVMFGSDSDFGGRKDYFKTHGEYKIFDVNTAIEEGKMTEEEKVWWGYSDDDLFNWSKEEVLKLAKEEKPFNFIMLTADTHFMDGYVSPNAENIYDSQYENVFAYSSKCVSEFVEWLQKQDFYENTTIVIVGDHLGMQTEFYEDNIKDEKYSRRVYNAFINSAIPASNNKNREFTTLDIFPTVLASMGAKIEGERLGLGTNLFSGRKTLIEEMGYDNFNLELSKKSNYYNKYLLKGDYLKMLKEVNSNKN